MFKTIESLNHEYNRLRPEMNCAVAGIGTTLAGVKVLLYNHDVITSIMTYDSLCRLTYNGWFMPTWPYQRQRHDPMLHDLRTNFTPPMCAADMAALGDITMLHPIALEGFRAAAKDRDFIVVERDWETLKTENMYMFENTTGESDTDSSSSSSGDDDHDEPPYTPSSSSDSDYKCCDDKEAVRRYKARKAQLPCSDPIAK